MTRALFVLLLALALAACTDDAIVDVGPDPTDEPGVTDPPPEDPNAVPYYDLGTEDDANGQQVGSGRPFVITDGLIQVNGKTFSRGFRIEGSMRLHFFFGYVDRKPYGEDSVDVGLFVYSDEEFEGAVEAGFFEDRTLQFSIEGYDVAIESADAERPMLGDGTRTPAYVLHVADFSWQGYQNVMGSAPELKYILERDALEWEFDLRNASIWVDDEQVKDAGGGVGQSPFEFFFMYFGDLKGGHGLLVISDSSFDGAESAGKFEGQELRFTANGSTFVVRTAADALLGDGGPVPAWVLHRPDFVFANPDGNPVSGIVMGATSDLESLLDRDVASDS
jgi:hypothetical protein